MEQLTNYLIEKYPHGCPLLKTFCEENPDIVPERRARNIIDSLEPQPDEVRACFKKRMGSWHVLVMPYAQLMTDGRTVIAA